MILYEDAALVVLDKPAGLSSEEGVPAAASNLKRLRGKLRGNPKARVREPEFMAVITGVSEYARKVEEGLYVVPITALGA